MHRALFLLAVASALVLAGCIVPPDNGGRDGGSSVCPAKPGEAFCGYCSTEQAGPDNPNGNKCRYCPQGYSCSFSDICSELRCKPETPDGGSGGANCPAKQGEVFCGYCGDDPASNPNGNKCRYCEEGSSCSGPICGNLRCVSGGGGSSGGGGGSGPAPKTYYASCSQCQGYYGTYSYRGGSYEVCNAYYQACVAARCGKILDNCR